MENQFAKWDLLDGTWESLIYMLETNDPNYQPTFERFKSDSRVMWQNGFEEPLDIIDRGVCPHTGLSDTDYEWDREFYRQVKKFVKRFGLNVKSEEEYHGEFSGLFHAGVHVSYPTYDEYLTEEINNFKIK